MKKVRWVSATAGTALVAATFALPGAGVAYAASNGDVTGNGNVPLLSGNTITAPISAPVNLCGISLGVLGFANSSCTGGASTDVVSSPSGGGAGNGGAGNGNVTGNGNVSTGSGNTISAPVSAPVNICGVSVAGGGFANSQCEGGAHTRVTEPSGTSGPGNGNVTGNGNVSTGSGNTISAPVSAPVNICGISLALLGFADSACVGGASTNVTGGTPTDNGNVTGNGNVSTGSGNTISAPVSAPVNICGVSLALAGFANSGCQGGSFVNPPSPPSCEGIDCTTPSCEGIDCTPPSCEGIDCTPPSCEGDQCAPPPCEGDRCAPPSCQDNCTPPTGSGTPPQGTVPTGTSPTGTSPTGTGPIGTGPTGTGPTGTRVTTLTSATMPSSVLPTTGADLVLMGVAALGSIGVGAGAIAVARRRRNGEAL